MFMIREGVGMMAKIKWFIRKIKIFMYLFPGILVFSITFWLSFFAKDKYLYPYENPHNELQEYVFNKEKIDKWPEIKSYRVIDNQINIEMEYKNNYVVFVDVYYKKTIGQIGLLKTETIHKCGYYKQSMDTQIVISGSELKQLLYPENPDSVFDLKINDIVIISSDNNKVSKPVRLLVSSSGNLTTQYFDSINFSNIVTINDSEGLK